MEMPTLIGNRVHIGGYVTEDVFTKMEESRRTRRRMSRSHWLEDAIVEKLQREASFSEPTQGPHGKRKRNAAA